MSGISSDGGVRSLPKSTSDVIDEALAAGIFNEQEAALLKSVWAQVKVFTYICIIFANSSLECKHFVPTTRHMLI